MLLTFTGVITFYLSYLIFPFLIYIIWQYNELNKPTTIFLISVCLLFLYARFLEPNIIRIRHHKIKLNKKIPAPFQIAVLADPHIGLFTGSWLLKRVVKKIKKIKPDFILILGDFVWHLPKNKIKDKFSCLKNLPVSTLVVLGNHDYGVMGEKDVSSELKKVLTDYGHEVIDNKIKEIKIKNQTIRIIGLSDIETRQPNYNLINNLSENNINIVLAHNPDAAYEFPSYSMDLVICGHTHGGQVRIYPFYKYAYKYIARMKHDFDKGLRNFRGTKIFITTGVGMTGLPFRFLMPPAIDILEIK